MITAAHTVSSAERIANSMVSTHGARPLATAGSSPLAAKATDNSDITSNDFLTLLVSELKNQDPTQPTDPNAYVQQLVGVNSLQQLIDINKGLSTLEDGTASYSSAAAPTHI